MASKRYTDQQLRDLTPTCDSIAELLRLLGLSDKGGNYKTMILKIAKLNIDTSHFTGQAHNKGKVFTERQSHSSHHLYHGSTIKSYSLKLRLIRDGYFNYECSQCRGTKWQGQPIPLELDHIDGDNVNNTIENLRLLCPNCHALTPTYRGKNQKRAK